MAHALDNYAVDVFDEDFRRVISTQDIIKIEWAQNWADKGGWLLDCNTGTELAEALATTRNARIAVSSRRSVIMTGWVTGSIDGNQVERSISIQDGSKEDRTKFTGRGYMALLGDRIILPDDGQSHYAISGDPATVATAIAARVTSSATQMVPHLQWATPISGGGEEMAFQFRYSNALAAVRKPCVAGGLNITIEQEGTGLVGRVTPARDQSKNVIFGTGNGTILDAQISRTPTDVTRAYMAGQGEGAARRIIPVEDENAPYLVEKFFDRRDIETDAELRTEGLIALEEGRGGHSLVVNPDSFSSYEYGTDYAVGDLVGVHVTAVREVQRVTQVTTSITADGLTRSVQIGAVPRASADGLLNQLKTFDNRLESVETI